MEGALEPELKLILRGPHRSKKFDLLWNGMRFPPKVVVSRAVELQYGRPFPESEFSGGEGNANDVLAELGIKIVDRSTKVPSLSLNLHERYGRKEIYATDGVDYDQRQRHLNTGLSPQGQDGGYLIFVTLDKEQLDPAHDYAANSTPII
jgi:hypothetical protein